jgi:hypothetical protein
MNSHTTTPPARRRRLTPVLLVSLLCLAGAILALAGSASAAVPGINLVTVTSPFNSANKSATVTCPAGDQVLGVGGGIDGGSGQVIVDDWMPLNPTQAAVRGVEEDVFAPNWDDRATAICADPLAGRTQVIATSGSSSVDKYITATCPVGKRLVASGADILSGGGDVMIEEMVPDLTTNSVTVLAHEEDSTPNNWRARASATCANPLSGLVRVFASSASNSTNSKTATASCPAGTVLTGTGAETYGSGGEAAIESIDPNASVNGVSARATEADSTSLNWTLSVFGICASA